MHPIFDSLVSLNLLLRIKTKSLLYHSAKPFSGKILSIYTILYYWQTPFLSGQVFLS